MTLRVFFLLSAVLAVTSTMNASAQTTTLSVSYFPGPATGALFAGIERGLFAKEGLAVTAEPTTGSVAQITAMMAGKYQLAFGGLDDGIAYDVGQGAVPVDGTPDFVAVLGTDSGPLHLVTSSDVTRVKDLKGRTFAVDARNTGFAFVLYHIAALNGLRPGDYEVLSVGSSQKRLEALSQGHAQAALMFKPVADQLVAKGFHDLMPASRVLPHYQAAVVLTRRSWAEAHRPEVVGFIRAYVAAARWFFDPANEEPAVALLMKAMNLPRPAAEAGWRASLVPAHDIGRIDALGVAEAVKLRETYAEPRKLLGDPHQFYDLSYYRAALAR